MLFFLTFLVNSIISSKKSIKFACLITMKPFIGIRVSTKDNEEDN